MLNRGKTVLLLILALTIATSGVGASLGMGQRHIVQDRYLLGIPENNWLSYQADRVSFLDELNRFAPETRLKALVMLEDYTDMQLLKTMLEPETHRLFYLRAGIPAWLAGGTILEHFTFCAGDEQFTGHLCTDKVIEKFIDMILPKNIETCEQELMNIRRALAKENGLESKAILTKQENDLVQALTSSENTGKRRFEYTRLV